MTSYKKINMLDLNIEDGKLKYNQDILTLKTPIILEEKQGNVLLLKINFDSKNHDIFNNLCGYINTIYNIKKIKTDIISNGCILLKETKSSRFFDENKNAINFNKIKSNQKIVSTFICDNGEFIIDQCLLVN